jgi:hypothetical protein
MGTAFPPVALSTVTKSQIFAARGTVLAASAACSTNSRTVFCHDNQAGSGVGPLGAGKTSQLSTSLVFRPSPVQNTIIELT